MTEMYKYPSIESFKHANKYVGFVCKTNDIPRPIIRFEGSVKMHGTNAGVLIQSNGEVSAQSRNNPITIENDNFGFAKFVEANKSLFHRFFHNDEYDVVVYGEWMGKGIQSGVAIAEVDRKFVIFDVSTIDGEFKRFTDDYRMIRAFSHLNEAGIYTTAQFKTFQVTIDFGDPVSMNRNVEELIRITDEVERECPVGKHFDVSGIGEGVVWKPLDVPEFFAKNDLYFKVKGEKHSVSKVKTTVTIDSEVLESIYEFIDYAITENRVKQAIHELSIGVDSVDGKKMTGKVIQWVMSDVAKEETDTMEDNNIDTKLLGKYAPDRIRKLFFQQIDL